jgi:hypothetical protein
MLLMIKGAVPVLDSVTPWAALVVLISWFPKGNEAGLTPAIGAIPVPTRPTVNGVGLLLVMVTVAVRVPLAVGVKVTLMVQLPAAATMALQVLV